MDKMSTDAARMITIPKAAAALVADATAAGMAVKIIEHSAHGFEVYIERDPTHNASARWHVTNVAGMNSRLGFATSYQAGVRFDYGSAQTGSTYPVVRSCRDVRRALGLPT